MSKIELTDNVGEILVKLSEGNPGALSTLFEIMNYYKNDEIKCALIFLGIDTMELYGSQLYMLWNDCCKRNINKTIKIILKYQDGKITDLDINKRIKDVGYGLSFDDLLGEEDEK